MTRKRILIADDDEICSAMLEEILRDKYDFVTASSGEETLSKVRDFYPDLLLLDVLMPDMTGFEVISAIHAGGDNLPVIFVTSQGETSVQTMGLQLGAVDYIAKPVNPTVLLARVANQLEMADYRNRLEKMVDQRTQVISETLNAVVLGMACLAECNDPLTGQHIQRVRNYSSILAKAIYNYGDGVLEQEDIALISDLSPVHDIGKVGVSEAILLKNGKLTDEEFKIMQRHPIFGMEAIEKMQTFFTNSQITDNEADEINSMNTHNRNFMLQKTGNWQQHRNKFLRTASDIAVAHHERWDGTGYPYGLAAENIPLSARIVTLADVYDALTTVRPYKKAFTHKTAMEIILDGDGRTKPEHFDPQVMRALRENEDKFTKLSAHAQAEN